MIIHKEGKGTLGLVFIVLFAGNTLCNCSSIFPQSKTGGTGESKWNYLSG